MSVKYALEELYAALKELELMYSPASASGQQVIADESSLIGMGTGQLQAPHCDVEEFALREFSGPASLDKVVKRVNRYQRQLVSTYEDWAESTAAGLEAAAPEDRDAIIAAAVATLIALLRQHGHQAIPEAAIVTAAGAGMTPRFLSQLGTMVSANDSFLDGSLGPSIADRLRQAVRDPAIMATGALAIVGALMALRARVAAYAGQAWAAGALGTGERATVMGRGVRWVLDDQAQHCDDCPRYAGFYPSFDDMLAQTGGAMPGAGVQCDGNCRCQLLEWEM
uniref:Uncharacterized protein n=2 Tax=viral metagenome TaxID=1070528 RepID=A0A6M3KKJ3_9ZZZZ